MARYIVDISERLVQRVNKLLDEHRYESMIGFIEVAIENQLSLEDSPLDGKASGSETGTAQPTFFGASAPKLDMGDLRIPGSVVLVDPPAMDQLLYSGYTEEDLYLWGQINRLFPVKLGLRVLASLTEERLVPLDTFWDVASKAARDVGLAIKARQDADGIKRTYAAWVGLPVGAKPEKSLSRYQSQFIGYQRRDEVLEGAMFRLKLTGLVDGNRIGLTEAGLRWAQAPNPILDEGDYSGRPLSREESFVYAEHVRLNVPEERRPLSELLSIVASGAIRTQEIDERLAGLHSDWKENVVLTMRAGALGRLWELGLVLKEGGHGTAVFGVTASGAEFLAAVQDTRGQLGDRA